MKNPFKAKTGMDPRDRTAENAQYRKVQRKMLKADKKLRELRAEAMAINSIHSGDLKELDSSIDNFQESCAKLCRLIERKINPEDWNHR